ncbi:MAG: tetratricopeptide repeat protein [Candidatus Marinimicrobia bacterium]|nr:tetratricopeptide repeat protein [Candidatus Neomarinimicrobiota bacterium]MCF7827933.1 tetratricopeptide repeat protein [Candidatus Neomarinimicrobiota bacterium]MCF7879312.1 tetratricopeptide repeat protein [Candidatus Neomarinimicrobiota bacterium]
MKKLLLLVALCFTVPVFGQTMPGMPPLQDSVVTESDTLLSEDLKSDPALRKWKSMLVDSVAHYYQDSIRTLRDSLARLETTGTPGASATSAVYDRFLEERYFRYLESLADQKQEKVLFGLFSRSNPEMEAFRINELQQYLQMFPPTARQDKVLEMLGDVYSQARQPAMALGAYLKQIMVFPATPTFSETQSKIIKMLGEESVFRNQKTTVITYLNNGIMDQDYRDNYYRYLEFLHRIRIPDMSPWYFSQVEGFLREFPHYEQNDNLRLWQAEMYETLNQFKKAAYAYQKLQVLHPESGYIPQTYYRLGVIYRDNTGENRKAADAFTSLARDFPSDSLAIPAQIAAAKVYADKMGQFPEAIEAYQRVVNNHPENPKAIDAMFDQAEIYLKKMNQPAKAIERYIAITEKYPDFKEQSGTAFRNAADIYADEIKDYATAVDMYMKFAQRYPNHQSVPSRLAKAADIAEDELNDYFTAIDLFELAQKKYPESNAAKTAERKLPDLREKAQQPAE